MEVLELECEILIHAQLPRGVKVKRSIIALPGGAMKILSEMLR